MSIPSSPRPKGKWSLAGFLHGLHHRGGGSAHGRGVIRWARGYDALVQVVTLGGERRLREGTLDRAGVFPGARVLDVGCGTGTLTLEAKRRAGAEGKVSGLDASPEMIARARAKAAEAGLAVELEVASAESLPFADGSFDVVLCSLALHHLHGDRRSAAVAEMHRVLVPGGRLLIVEIAPEAGLLAALHPLALLHRHGGDIVREAEALLAGAGFRDLGSGGVGVRNLRFVRGTKAIHPG